MRSKKFECTFCGNTTYQDYKVCIDCHRENTIRPIPKNEYKCYLNGSYYGSGNLKHIHELFRNYVIHGQMHGRDECDFKIVKIGHQPDQKETK